MCENEIRKKLNKLIRSSCFSSFNLQTIDPNKEWELRCYNSKRFKIFNYVDEEGVTKTASKECKSNEMLSNWEDVKEYKDVKAWKEFDYFNMTGRVTPQSVVWVENSILSVFGDPSFRFQNLLRMKLDSPIRDYTAIHYDDVKFTKFTELEKLILLKNTLQYCGSESDEFCALGKLCHIYKIIMNRNKEGFDKLSKILRTVRFGARSEAYWDWMYGLLSVANDCGVTIPNRYDNKGKLIYSFEVWRKIKNAYYGDEEEIPEIEGLVDDPEQDTMSHEAMMWQLCD